MKITIPYWQGRISPVFDTASRILFVDVENGREVRRRKKSLFQQDPLSRAKSISQLGVEVLICGAISWSLKNALTSSGVRVISCICGPVEDVIDAFLKDRLTDRVFLMPGCCSRHQSAGPLRSATTKSHNKENNFNLNR